eukprot:4301996-Amphidinium_carterae.1
MLLGKKLQACAGSPRVPRSGGAVYLEHQVVKRVLSLIASATCLSVKTLEPTPCSQCARLCREGRGKESLRAH